MSIHRIFPETGTTTPASAPAATPTNAATPEAVRQRLALPGDDGEELLFDAATGKLVLKKRGGAPAPEQAPVTSIARDGFFGSR